MAVAHGTLIAPTKFYATARCTGKSVHATSIHSNAIGSPATTSGAYEISATNSNRSRTILPRNAIVWGDFWRNPGLSRPPVMLVHVTAARPGRLSEA